MNKQYYITLDKAFDINLVGGKAYMLCKLINGGAKTPNGLVISTNLLYDFLIKSGISEEDINLALLLNNACLKKIQDVLNTAPWTTEILNILKEIYKQFPEPCCVRSSAVLEDNNANSFAGIYHSKINIRSFNEFINAIRDCWLSAFKPQAIEYVKRINSPLSLMALVVMPVVDAQASGVALIEDNKCIISVAYGLGEGIVSGKVACDILEWNARDSNENTIIKKKEYCYLVNNQDKPIYFSEFEKEITKNTQNRFKMISADERQAILYCKILNQDIANKPVLNNKLQVELKDTIYDLVENILGEGKWDIEWAIDNNDKIYILQSRPLISSILAPNDNLTFENSNAIFKGQPFSSGIGTGVVKIVQNTDDLKKVQDGDIVMTDWIPDNFSGILSKVSALIIRGNSIFSQVFSHCAIIAREWQIPCVGGIPKDIIKEGTVYKVNGSTGEIFNNINISNPIISAHSKKESSKINEIYLKSWLINSVYEVYARENKLTKRIFILKKLLSTDNNILIDISNICLCTKLKNKNLCDLYDKLFELALTIIYESNPVAVLKGTQQDFDYIYKNSIKFFNILQKNFVFIENKSNNKGVSLNELV